MGATARTIQDDEVSLGELHQSWRRAEALLLRRVALHGYILSEIQSPPENRKVFNEELHWVGKEATKMLRELGQRVYHMLEERVMLMFTFKE